MIREKKREERKRERSEIRNNSEMGGAKKRMRARKG